MPRLVRAAPTAPPLEVDETACGVVGASGEEAVWNPVREYRRKGSSRTGGWRGESRLLERCRIRRVLVTTSRLQRLVRGIFSSTGSRRFGAGCTWGSSVRGPLNTVTGG